MINITTISKEDLNANFSPLENHTHRRWCIEVNGFKCFAQCRIAHVREMGEIGSDVWAVHTALEEYLKNERLKQQTKRGNDG